MVIKPRRGFTLNVKSVRTYTSIKRSEINDGKTPKGFHSLFLVSLRQEIKTDT